MDTVQTTVPQETPDDRDVRLNKDVAAFSYVWIMSVVVLASRRDSAFIQYHAKQATILFLISIPVAMLPFVGKYLIFFVLAGMLLGFIHAANGRREGIPIICDLATGSKTPKDVLLLLRPYTQRVFTALQGILRKPSPTPPASSTPEQQPLDNATPKT